MIPISELKHSYLCAQQTPRQFITRMVNDLRAKVALNSDPAWIWLASPAQIEAQLVQLETLNPLSLPLLGVPFAIKDNIDVKGWITTAACPAFAHTAKETATVVKKLMQAGAILIGKTNLDQFATGLVGTRSPYGAVPNTFNADYVSGGSSSGSASVVARGLVCFSLGTDTAGSGRIPAGFNNIVGMKPTPGLVSIEGVLPACKTLDCVSVFAGTAADAAIVLSVMQSSTAERASEPQFHPAHTAQSCFPAKLRIGIPLVPEFLGNLEYKNAFIQAISSARSIGAIIRQIDFSALNRVASLLYSGPWVAERYVTIEHLLNTRPETLDPSVSKVVSLAEQFSAADAFKALYELKEHALRAQEIWSECDVLLVPTAPTHPTMKEVAADPILRNSELGLYTNFVNLLEMSAIAVPAGLTDSGMPFGVTFIAPGGYDQALLSLGERWQSIHKLAPGAPQANAPFNAHYLRIAVVGAHLQGMPLHQQLVDRQCRLIERTKTSSSYRLYALANTSPPKPGLVRSIENGHQIELEVYEMPSEHVGSFLELIAAPLGLGSVELADGSWVKGFICEPWAIAQAQDISQLGGWRAYVESNVNPS